MYLKNHNSLDQDLDYGLFEPEAYKLLLHHPDKSYYLIFSRMDHMRHINETYGYQSGSRILKMLAYYLRAQIGRHGAAGMISVNEFVELRELKGCLQEEAESAKKRQEEFCRYQKEHFGVENLSIKSGVYQINSQDADISKAIEAAQAAAEKCRSMNGCYCQVYDRELDEALSWEHKVFSSMQAALAQKEFAVWYQPKWDVNRDEICGMEALVRWIKPDGTVISPDRFIPIFERNGFIEKLDMFVLTQVIADLKEWKEKGYTLLPVSVNLSDYNISRGKNMEQLKQLADSSGLEHRLLEFELTETLCHEDPELVFGVLRQLRSEGYGISLDDFGAGYSMLGLLPSIPADIIKMDKSFLSGDENLEKSRLLLVHLIHAMNDMGFTVLCEGVEEKEQVNFLKMAGCKKIQGYYYAKPLPKNVLEEKFLHREQIEEVHDELA